MVVGQVNEQRESRRVSREVGAEVSVGEQFPNILRGGKLVLGRARQSMF